MRKRMGVVNRKYDRLPLFREQQPRRHRDWGDVTAARDVNGRADHLLQLRRLWQRRSNVEYSGRGVGIRRQRCFGHPYRSFAAASDKNRSLSCAQRVANELNHLEISKTSSGGLLR